MGNIMIVVVLLLAVAGSASADGRSVTFFADCALVELEVKAAKGVVEVPLPAAMSAASLRIKPLGSAEIRRVDLLTPPRPAQPSRELASQQELKSRLEDRLRALDAREEIFRAAAKTQSSKAPRRSKTNPDPVKTLRQGTEFAFAQLEAVYTARRKAEQELRHCDARIAVLKRQGQAGTQVARVAVTPPTGTVLVHYALEGKGWTPTYDLRLGADGAGDLTLYGRLPDSFAGYRLRAYPGPLADSRPERILQVAGGQTVRLAEYRLPVRDARFAEGVNPSFTVVVQNNGEASLPAGEAVLYHYGEYRGRFRFEGISSGRSKRMTSVH